MKTNKTYKLSEQLANLIILTKGMSAEGMASVFKEYLQRNDKEEPAVIIANILAMSQSVISNISDELERELISSGKMSNDQRLNMPSLAGAAMGSKMANTEKGKCGCAFKLGSFANQCEATVFSAGLGDEFFCHQKGKKKLCKGWIRAKGQGK